MQTKKIKFITLFLFGTISSFAQWVPISPGSGGKFESIYFFDAQNGIASANGKVIKTTNAGDSWSIVDIIGIRDIDFVSTTIGYAAGVVSTSLKKTVDGGTTWSPLTPVTSNSLWGVSAVNANTVYVCGTGNVVWKSTNGGSSFSAVNLPATSSDLVVDIDFTSTTTGCALGQIKGVWRTTNGGNSWVNTYSTPGIFFTSIYFVDALNGFAVGSNGGIIKTTDGGISWVLLNSGSTVNLEYVHFIDPSNGIVAGNAGTILRTTDGGNSWFQENTGTTTNLFCCILLSPTVALAGGSGGLMIKNTNLTTAVNEAHSPSNCTIFPNPTEGLFSVNSDYAKKSLKVFNSFGRLVWESSDAPAETSIDLSGQSRGVYFVKVESEGAIRTFKIVRE